MKQEEGTRVDLPVCTPDGQEAYHIYIEPDFSDLTERLSGVLEGTERICLISDDQVYALYGEEVRMHLGEAGREVYTETFPAGEAHKNLDTVRSLLFALTEHCLDRHDVVVALGGGVTGDMAGFVSAIYLRGIRFIQIPTTLLAQVDSSIGGKTGVDLQQYKNLVGAFHQPSMVYIAAHTLTTLSEDQFACGMGEVLKHGLIRDEAYYEWTLDHMAEIEMRSLPELMQLIEGSCRIKRAVVEKDPYERGERAVLNFGHTLGHAIEKLTDFSLSHGACVSLGAVAAAYISWQRGYLSEDEFYEIRDMMVAFNLPITCDGLRAADVIEATRHDKKMASGQIRFILLHGIGEAYIDNEVTDSEMSEALARILV